MEIGKLGRRYIQVNPLNRMEFIEHILQSGKIDILLVTLQKIEKYVKASTVRSFASMFLTNHHKNLLKDIEIEVKKNFCDYWGDLNEDGFFIINLICYSGDAVERTSKQCKIVRLFFYLLAAILGVSFYFHSIEISYLWIDLGALFLLQLIFYILLYRALFIELTDAFFKIKESMTIASLKISKSCIDLLELSLEFKYERAELGGDLGLEKYIRVLVSEIVDYESQVKGRQVLENSDESENLNDLNTSLDKVRKESNTVYYRYELSNAGIHDRGAVISSAFTDAIKLLDSQLKNRLNASNTGLDLEMRHQRRTLIRLASLFDVHKMDAVTKVDFMKTIKETFKMGDTILGDKFGGDKVGGDKVGGDKVDTFNGYKIGTVNGQNLAQAATDIKNILDQLSLEYPADTPRDLGEKAVDKVKKNPDVQSKIARVLQAGSFAALEGMLDHPAAKFFIEGAKEALKP